MFQALTTTKSVVQRTGDTAIGEGERRGTSGSDVDLKNLEHQVVVVTGATSGIGLATARMAAERGARVVLAARSEDALAELTEEIRHTGGDAAYVVADVTDREDVRQIARTADELYGGFDTWVNVAGAFLYGRLEDTPVEDMREQFETNVWGLLYGSLAATEHLRERGGGAIINVGSVASDRAIPLQGSYSASKHAVKGFTDALRMELEEDGAPISVTLVKPASIDTPYPEHAKNHMDEAATLPSPIYAPETVAEAILHAAEEPQRDVYVGGGAAGMGVLEKYAAGLVDVLMERLFFDQQRGGRPPEEPDESGLDESVGDLEERGDYDGHVAESSAYTRMSQGRSSARRMLAIGVIAASAYGLYRRLSRNR